MEIGSISKLHLHIDHLMTLLVTAMLLKWSGKVLLPGVQKELVQIQFGVFLLHKPAGLDQVRVWLF